MKTFWLLSAILLLHAACLQGISPPHNPPSPITKPTSPPDCVKPVHYPNLKTTFNRDPSKGFTNEPRNRSEAVKAGFELIASGCEEGKDKYPYPGDHYTQKHNNETGSGGEINLIYDVNGIIAGMSGVIPVVSAEDPNPNLFKHPTFQKAPGLDGTENYVSTVYFIDPSRVCRGRSKKEFEEEGTGTGLYIVNGPTAEHIIAVPLDEPDDETTKDKILYKAECTISMGTHYFLHDPTKPESVGSDCGNAPGILVLYHPKGHILNGFVLRPPVLTRGNRWEFFSSYIMSYLYGQTYPPCYGGPANNGVNLMHVYLGPYEQFCPGTPQYNDPRNDFWECSA